MSGFIPEASSNRFLLRVAVTAAIAAFLFGYDTGVIGGALLFIEADSWRRRHLQPVAADAN